jgi:hypothetical protein
MNMKKNRDASELAARIAAAARQPAGTNSAPAALVSPQSAAEVSVTSSLSPRRKREKADVPDTVPITLRPEQRAVEQVRDESIRTHARREKGGVSTTNHA